MSLRKSETLTRWTLLDTFCLHFWVWLLNTVAITPKSEGKKCPKVFNLSEFHFSEVTFFQNWYFYVKLVHVNKNCAKYQILISTISENFIQINQLWPQLQPKMWSEAILRIYSGLDHFLIDSLQKCILEAAIDRLDIHLGTISPFNQHWIFWQSMVASKLHFWRLSMIKWSKPV